METYLMNNPSIIVTRPRYDLTTNYLYYWAGLIIAEAKKRNLEVFDLKDTKANASDFIGRVKKKKPNLFFLNGHGSYTTVTGQDGDILVSSDKNPEILSGAIIYALSCKSAQVLGAKAIASGAKTYLGYKEDFVFVYEDRNTTRPLQDKTAAQFLGPSNQLIFSLIKGNSTKDAYKKSQRDFKRNIQKLSVSSVPQQDKRSVPLLYWDMEHLVCLGNHNAKI